VIALGAVFATAGAVVSTLASALAADALLVLPTLSAMR
jgi:hypothetical protein